MRTAPIAAVLLAIDGQDHLLKQVETEPRSQGDDVTTVTYRNLGAKADVQEPSPDDVAGIADLLREATG